MPHDTNHGVVELRKLARAVSRDLTFSEFSALPQAEAVASAWLGIVKARRKLENQLDLARAENDARRIGICETCLDWLDDSEAKLAKIARDGGGISR
jgi:hypothetical protein